MTVKSVKSAHRVLAVFEAVALYQPVGAGELTRLMADDNSAIHRALATLAEAGWIDRIGDLPRWAVAQRVVSIAAGRSNLVKLAQASLDDLRDRTGETAVLGVAEGAHIVVVAVAESGRMIRAAPRPGTTVLAATSSLGQAILSRLSDEEIAAFTADEPASDVKGLRRRLAVARELGWARKHHSPNDRDPDLNAVAAAILTIDDRPLGAVALSGPLDRMPDQTSAELGPLVAEAAARLSGLLPKAEE